MNKHERIVFGLFLLVSQRNVLAKENSCPPGNDLSSCDTNKLLLKMATSLEAIENAESKKNATWKNIKQILKGQNPHEQSDMLPEEGYGQMLLPGSYWKVVPPLGFAKPTPVSVGLQPRAITSINSLEKSVEMEIHMSLTWEDSRIQWPQLNILPKEDWMKAIPLNPTICR